MINTLHNDVDRFFTHDNYRKHQKETIVEILDTYAEGKGCYVLEAPTGFGKSATAVTAARVILDDITKRSSMCSPPIIVCTRTRNLQDQYLKAFPKLKVERLWSATHYPCELYPNDSDFHYGSILCPGEKRCYKADSCKYLQAKASFKTANIGVLNYHYFLYSREFMPSVLILDEAHNIEDILCSMMEIKITMKHIRVLCEILNKLHLEYDRGSLVNSCKNVIMSKELDRISLQSFYDQVVKISYSLNKKKTELLSDSNINKFLMLAKSLAKGIKIVDKLIDKLNKYFDSKSEWIVSQNKEDFVTIKPLDISENSGILKMSEFTILMSATICNHKQFCKTIYLDENDCGFKSVPSEIPRENRIVYEMNIGSMNNRNKNDLFPLFVKSIDKILDQIKNERGIVHSVSYANARKILELSKHSDRMIIPEDLLSIEECLKSSKNTVLVSPAIMEGVDLKDDISRFQIFFKIPYGYLGDKWIKTKMERDYKWYMRNAAIKLVQGSGRSIRSMEDHACTFILDANFSRLLNMMPQWYTDAIEKL